MEALVPTKVFVDLSESERAVYEALRLKAGQAGPLLRRACTASNVIAKEDGKLKGFLLGGPFGTELRSRHGACGSNSSKMREVVRLVGRALGKTLVLANDPGVLDLVRDAIDRELPNAGCLQLEEGGMRRLKGYAEENGFRVLLATFDSLGEEQCTARVTDVLLVEPSSRTPCRTTPWTTSGEVSVWELRARGTVEDV